MNLILEHAGPIGAGILFGMAFYPLFAWADGFFPDHVKENLANRLKRIEASENAREWPEYFIALFDKIFTDKHISLKCFFRSCLASITFVLVLWFLFQLNSEEFVLYSGELESLLVLIAYVLSVNMVWDYVSLLKTRFVLKEMHSKRASKILLFGVDLVLTLVILFFGMVLSLSVLLWLIGGTFGLLTDSVIIEVVIVSIELIVDNLTQTPGFLGLVANIPGSVQLAPAIYSTLLTTVWVWLYVLADTAFRCIAKNAHLLVLIQKYLPIDERPFRSIGVIACIIACFGYWVVLLVDGTLGKSVGA